VSVGAYLDGFRTDAEGLMVDTCRITSPGGAPVFNNETGQYDQPEPVTVYEGPCKLKVANVATQNPDAGERQWTVQRTELHLPVAGSEGVRVAQTALMLTSQHDAASAGRRFRVSGLHHETYATARRLEVEEVTG